MYYPKKLFLISLIAGLMALIPAACSDPGIENLPFPREQVTNRWRVDGTTLIERTYDSNRAYYLYSRGEAKIIIGEAYDLEFQKNVDGRLYFTSHSWDSTMTISFPYIRWHDINTAAEGTGKAYLGMEEGGFWGTPVKGRLLSDLQVAGDNLEFTFGVKREEIGSFVGNVPWYFPLTKAVFDQKTGELVFCFYHTEARGAAFEAAQAFKGNDLFASLQVEQLKERLAIRPDEVAWWLRGLKAEDFVPFPAAVVRLKPRIKLRYTLAGGEANPTPPDLDPNSPKERKYILQFVAGYNQQ